jgi:hypothetical protein
MNDLYCISRGTPAYDTSQDQNVTVLDVDDWKAVGSTGVNSAVNE